MKLYIKYMVSLRCKLVVKAELEAIGLAYKRIDLGEVELTEAPREEQKKLLRDNLLKSGLELDEESNSTLVEQIAVMLVEMIYYSDDLAQVNFTRHLATAFNRDYKSLSTIFSEVKGVSIQQFIISNKIERTKELLLYENLSLSEIAHKLNYSSVAHLSNQFKKLTGHTPSFYQELKKKRVKNSARP